MEVQRITSRMIRTPSTHICVKPKKNEIGSNIAHIRMIERTRAEPDISIAKIYDQKISNPGLMEK